MSVSNIILKALRDVVNSVEELELKYCLFGGLAMQAYKRIRATMDLDFIVSLDKGQISKFILQFGNKGLRFDEKRGVKQIGDFDFIRFYSTDREYQIDIPIDFVTSRTDFQRQIICRRKESDILGVKVYIASCEDLILLKLLAGRPLDMVDAGALIEENRDDLDRKYLKKWAKLLNLERRLSHMLL